jgi:predicted TIM-barrel fold metal-dependent hydrolase
MEIGDPKHIDIVAGHFPGLKLVLGHGGVGFGLAGCMVADRHSNMFIDFTGIHPRYLPPEMIQMINSVFRNKAIFGTNFPCLSFDIVEEWKKVIKPENQPLFFYNNAARALGLGPGE